jgi:hypothetical protein
MSRILSVLLLICGTTPLAAEPTPVTLLYGLGFRLLVVVVADHFVDRQVQRFEGLANRLQLLGLAILRQVADDQAELRLLGVRLHLLDEGLQPRQPFLVEMMEVIDDEKVELACGFLLFRSQGAGPESCSQETAGRPLEELTTREFGMVALLV